MGFLRTGRSKACQHLTQLKSASTATSSRAHSTRDLFGADVKGSRQDEQFATPCDDEKIKGTTGAPQQEIELRLTLFQLHSVGRITCSETELCVACRLTATVANVARSLHRKPEADRTRPERLAKKTRRRPNLAAPRARHPGVR